MITLLLANAFLYASIPSAVGPERIISRPLGTHAARAFIHDTPNADLLAGRRPA